MTESNTTPGSERLNAPKDPKAPALLSNYPGMDLLLKPLDQERPVVNNSKIRRLYMQASMQQWFVPDKLDFESEIQFEEPQRKVWAHLLTVFYTMEKMGLTVIQNMAPKAIRKLRSEDVSHYLSIQTLDESRHVFAAENYLRRIHAAPKYERKYHILGQVASLGCYRVENWLFSTLFSENYASAFLRRMAKNDSMDTLGAVMAKTILHDESRHLHFLHIVLPDILSRLSLFGRTYVKASQYFIMKFTEMASVTLGEQASEVGIDRVEMLEEVFENVEKAYESFGVTRDFLWFPKIQSNGFSKARLN